MIEYKTAVLVAAVTEMAIYESEGILCLTLILDKFRLAFQLQSDDALVILRL
jgi:uncharacterized protein YehS (DUF1456 family)